MSKHISNRQTGILFISLFALLWIISVVVMVNSAYPHIKYRLLTSGIMTGILAFVILCGLIFICHKAPLSKFKNRSNSSKIEYSIMYLIFSVGFIWCIEYLIYQKNRDQFVIEQEFIDTSMRDKADNINTELEYYQTFDSIYTKIACNILQEEYQIVKMKDKIYLPIESDTLILHLNKINSMVPRTMPNRDKDNIDYYGIRSIGVSVPGESYNLSHPSSREILNQIKHNGIVQGDNLEELINQKITFYHQRCSNLEVLLTTEDTISFISFLWYNIFNYSFIAKSTSFIVLLLVLIQTILITLISGYIYSTIYKILDGE